MTTKTAILTFALLLLMAAGVVVGIYLVRQNQDVRSRADTTITDPNPTANTAGTGAQAAQQGAQGDSCTPPAEVTNVAVDYPSCD
jgi:hypothetical protein